MDNRRRVAWVTVALAALVGACGDSGGDGPLLTKVTTTKANAATGSGTTSAASGPTGSVAATTTVASAPPTVFTTTPAGSVAGPATLSAASAVTTAGLGPLTFGMPVATAEKAIGSRLLPDTAFSAAAQCIVVKPENGPDAVWFTVSKGNIERLDVRPPSKVKTRSGAGIASTEASLKSLFAEKLVVTAVAPAKRAIYTPTDAANVNFRIIFELDAAGAVTSYRAGRVGVIENPTPCA